MDGYRVLRRRPRQGEDTLLVYAADTGSRGTFYTDTGATEPGELYVYRVKALRGEEESGRSNYVNVEIPESEPERTPEPTREPTREPTPEATEPPAAPQNLIAAVAHDRVVLSWDDPGDDSITGYRILRRETDRQDPGVFTTIDEDTGSAEIAYTDDTVEPEMRYVYRVKAINAGGVSEQSGYADADTPAEPGIPPQSAADATLSSLTVSPGSIDGFASGRSEYHVGVASTVSRVTITAEPTDPTNATVSYRDADYKALADDTVDGHQVDLSYGRNTVRMRVSFWDATTGISAVKIYDVHVARGVTAAYGWKAEDDFNTLAAAGNDDPWGLWSDGEIMWVADTEDGKMYAYDLDTKERVAGKDFETMDAASRHYRPHCIWSDGETMWISDVYGRYLFAYDLESKERVPGKDFHNLAVDGVKLLLGLWSDGRTMWRGTYVVDGVGPTLYAYDPDSMERVPGRDFDTLAPGTVLPIGNWSDGRTMWVSDLSGEKLYAYNMPVSDNADLRTLTLDGEAVAGFDPATTTYFHGVAETVTRVTVAAEARQLLAEVTTITPDDADAVADGHQVDIPGGDDAVAVTITVTAQDGTTKTYTVNVRR